MEGSNNFFLHIKQRVGRKDSGLMYNLQIIDGDDSGQDEAVFVAVHEPLWAGSPVVVSHCNLGTRELWCKEVTMARKVQ